MKIGFSPESIVYLDGKPLAGRITLFAHDSDTAIDVYTLQGDAFVQAQNPQLLNDAGRLDDTIFFDAAIVDVLVERYIGAEGQMSVSSPDSDFETFDSFEIGFDASSIEGADTVETIADLKDADPSKKFVTVMGYYAVGDCMPRTYYWDADSVNAVDGGYVVGSNVEDSGRWILLWGDEIIPSSVYGIVAGVNETNIGAFLSYPDTVGSFLQKTAKVARFLPGDYSTAVSLTTTKEMAFDAGAKFSTASFTIPKMSVIGNSTGYIAAGFTFTASDSVAHSAWFKTAKAFLKSGAKRLVVDSTNYFTDSEIDELVTVSNCTLEYPTNTRLAVTYGVDGRIILSNVNLVGVKIFNATDNITFNSMKFTDAWFSQDGSLIDFTDKVRASTTDGNTLLLANFASTAAYVNALQADGQTVLDLAGRKAGGIAASTFTEIRNVYCDLLNIFKTGEDVILKNVHCGELVASARILTIADGCDVRFKYIPIVTSIEGRDSRIGSAIAFSGGDIPASFQRCYVAVPFSYAGQDNVTRTQPLKFKDCIFQDNVGISAKDVEMYRCVTHNNSIKVYPYQDGGAYYFKALFEGNTFDSTSPIEFTKFDMVGGALDEDCHDILLDVKFVGNQFRGNSEGIRMRYWQNRAGTYSSRTFIKETNTGHVFEYSGNVGDCPAESMRGVVVADNTAYATLDLGGATLYRYASACKRTAVNPNNSATWWLSVPVDNSAMMTKYYGQTTSPWDNLSYDLFIQDAMYYRKSRDLAYGLDNGDFFALAVCSYDDYIRIVQSGSGDKNVGVIARIV